MDKIYKTFEVEIIDKNEHGGRIRINTGAQDRDRDRVLPLGARIANYLANPVVMWGHEYRLPASTIGRTNNLEISENGIIADFILRPAANEQDPQNVVKLLWDGNWVRTASVGFIPIKTEPNDFGGVDFLEWELLEWSIVPIPSNQDALRLAVKSLDALPYEVLTPIPEDGKEPESEPVEKRGRVLSRANENTLRKAYDAIGSVLSKLESQDEAEDSKSEIVMPPDANPLTMEFIIEQLEELSKLPADATEDVTMTTELVEQEEVIEPDAISERDLTELEKSINILQELYE